MVLDDEYGEFEMLNVDVVKLVFEFNNWAENDGFSSLKDESEISDDDPYLIDLWRSEIIGFYGDETLTPNEEQRLKSLLETERNVVHYEVVSEYIRWVLRHLQWGNLKDEMRFIAWCEKTEGGEALLQERALRSDYFSHMLPHYIDSLRRLLAKAPIRAFQQEAA
jgi:hypothetical protein